MKVNEAALDLWGYGEEEILEGYLNVIQAFDTNGGSIEPLSRPVMRALLEGKAVTDHLQYVKGRHAVSSRYDRITYYA